MVFVSEVLRVDMTIVILVTQCLGIGVVLRLRLGAKRGVCRGFWRLGSFLTIVS